MANRIVITGAPSSGKSTLIRMLRDIGYNTLDEQAEIVIKEGELLPWNSIDRDGFQDCLFARQFEREEFLNGCDDTFFLDRGLFDGEAYSLLDGLDNGYLYKYLSGSRYCVALVLDPLPTFEQTDVRREDASVVQRLTDAIESTYRNHNVTVVRIPVLPPQQRLEYVLAVARGYCFIVDPEKVSEVLDEIARLQCPPVCEALQPAICKSSAVGSLLAEKLGVLHRLKAGFSRNWPMPFGLSKDRAEVPLPYDTQDYERLLMYRSQALKLISTLTNGHPARAVWSKVEQCYREYRAKPEVDRAARRIFKDAYKSLVQHLMPADNFHQFIQTAHILTSPSEANWRLYLANRAGNVHKAKR